MKKKRINSISKVIFLALLAISIVIFGIVIKLNVLPTKYLIPVVIIYSLLLLGMGSVSFKRKFKSWFKILIDIISIVLIIGFIAIYYYLNTTLNFMDKIKAGKFEVESFYVLVKKESIYSSLDDINNKELGIYDDVNKNYKKSLNELQEKIKIKEKKYNDYISAGHALINSEVDAILISSAQKSILEDIIQSFNDSVKIIDTIEIKKESNVEVNKVDVVKEPFNVYISGIDIYGDIASVSRSDVNMIMTVNPNTHKVLLTSIPRDYYVQLHGTTGVRDKLTHAGMYGINMSIETLEDLFDINIDYYVRVNFTTLISLVDAIGGIDIYSDTAFTAWTDPSCRYKVGNMHLNGKCSLAYSRERHAYLEGDRHRVRNQQDVISAIMNKALSSKTLITKYSKILESMSNSFQTSIPTNSIYDLVNLQLEKMPNWDIESYSLNGSDKLASTYSSGSQQLYVMEPDINTVKEGKTKISNVLKGL